MLLASLCAIISSSKLTDLFGSYKGLECIFKILSSTVPPLLHFLLHIVLHKYYHELLQAWKIFKNFIFFLDTLQQ